MHHAAQTASRPAARILRWPSHLLGPRPNLKELHLACWGFFLGLMVMPVCFGFWVHHRVSPGTLPPIASGFTYFYGIGKIVDTYPIARLYDYPLQLRTFHEVWAQGSNEYGPSPYPPFIALFFSLFARLSFARAYAIWMIVSLALYVIGIVSTAGIVFPRQRMRQSLMVCLSLAYYPFLYGTLLNGRISTIEVCAIGVALLLESRGKPVFSGLALSALIYKPTLLLLILPALLLTRRFRTLYGFLAGAALLLLATTGIVGYGIWIEYARFLSSFSHLHWLGNQSVLNYARYVDLKSLSYMLPGGRSPAVLALLAAFALGAALSLAVLLWRSARSSEPVQLLAWAAILTWTLILNVYVPIYDSILVVPALSLTLAALHALRRQLAADGTALLAILILAFSWVSESIAQHHRFQILTFLFVILGCLQLALLYRAQHHATPKSSQTAGAPHASVLP